MHAIDRDVFIAAPTDVVWRTITEPEQVRRWFADDVDLDATPGEDGALTFTHDDAEPSIYVFTVQSVEPERLFSYRWHHPAGAVANADNSVLVEFTLTPEGTGTRLRVVETGVEKMDWSADEQAAFIADHTNGWTSFLARLERYVTTGSAD